jgi:hypothetical protein
VQFCFLALSSFAPASHVLLFTPAYGDKMSLIKAADVPKHMADRLRSRRIAARLSGGGSKPIVPAKDRVVAAPISLVDTRTT